VTFCPRCGAAHRQAPPTSCARCAYSIFVNPRPTAGLIVLDGAGRFLALRRSAEPCAGEWELPGGFCDGWEHPADAAVREGWEELGVRVNLHDFVGMYIGSYEFQQESLPVLDCYWLASIDAGQSITVDPRESSGHTWFALDTPPPLAFSTMDLAIRDAIKRLGG
jgi:ADP-ribose pyrophosphatase YjhB (NUDIX family)